MKRHAVHVLISLPILLAAILLVGAPAPALAVALALVCAVMMAVMLVMAVRDDVGRRGDRK